MGRKEDLNEALKMQHEIVMQGGDGSKVEVEKYKILHEMVLAENKYSEDGEFKESEMVLKEKAAELEREKFEMELALKERDAKVKKAETMLKRVQVYGEVGTGLLGLYFWRTGFKSLVANEETIHVIPQRPFMFLKGIESMAIKGLGKMIRL